MPHPTHRRPWFLLHAVLLATFAASAAPAGFEYESIRRADADGSAPEILLPASVAEGRGALAVDQQHVYWVGGSFDAGFGNFMYLRRTDLNGDDLVDLIGPTAIGDVEIDTEDEWLYLTPQSDCAPGCTWVARSSLPGTYVESLFPAGFPVAIGIEPASDLVCWTDNAFGEQLEPGIACGTVGDHVGQIVVQETARGLAIDPLQQKLYWTTVHTIRRANLDGSGIETIVTGLDNAYGITLDPAGNRLWWTERSLGTIQTADLDGTDVETIVVGQVDPTAIDFSEGKIYWLSEPPRDLPVPASSTGGALMLAIAIFALSTRRVLRRRGALG